MHVNKRNQNQNKANASHIQTDHAFFCLIYPASNAMISLKDGFTVLTSDWKEDLLSMMSGNDKNQIFFNKKI